LPEAKTNKAVYEVRSSDGEIYGVIGPRDWDRFRQTLAFVPPDARSLLDCGCDRGNWLDYVCRLRKLEDHMGVDVSAERIGEARTRYPHLHVEAGYLEDLHIKERSYDIVTALEVLEHIPEWAAVLDRLLTIAQRRVIVTVPYREQIIQTVCIHCARLTPLYGHLHSFSEESFPARPGWRLSFGYIRDRGIGASLARRVYRILRPRRAWLVAVYDRIHA